MNSNTQSQTEGGEIKHGVRKKRGGLFLKRQTGFTMKKAPTKTCKCLIFLERPGGFEPPTSRFVVCHSIQLSYGRAFM